jgi:hypothetical protein
MAHHYAHVRIDAQRAALDALALELGPPAEVSPDPAEEGRDSEEWQ